MRWRPSLVFLAVLMVIAAARVAEAQEVVDRIVARVENDIILLSDIRTLSRYQLFVDGKSESDLLILDRLIDQWIVRTEAEVSHTPRPSENEIDRSWDHLRDSFTSQEEFEARKRRSGLSDGELREILALQLYLSDYLDARFRPAVRVESKAIEDFYQNAVVPQAKARGQEPPTLDAARDYIQEALVQRGINEQAEQWLKESRVRLHIEKKPNEVAR